MAVDRAPRIRVAGSGTARLPADLARAVFVAEAVRDSAAAARSTAAAIAAGIVDALRAAGVAETDLRTAGLEVAPNWEHDGSRMVRRGFTVTNRIGVAIRDLDSVGSVLDAGLEAGATGLDHVVFTLADDTVAATEARRAAVADARHRAETIATAAGGRLGKLRSIVEGTVASPFAVPQGRMMAMATSDAPPTPVMPGVVEVTVTVTAAWELVEG